MSPSVNIMGAGIRSPLGGRKGKRALTGGERFANVLEYFGDCHVILPSQALPVRKAPEAVLWLMVLADAAQDIVKGIELEVVEEWLDPESLYCAPIDFDLCCELAGADPVYVRNRFTKAIATARLRKDQGTERQLDRRTRPQLRHPLADIGGRSRFGHAHAG